jgi:hypothetical protein
VQSKLETVLNIRKVIKNNWTYTSDHEIIILIIFDIL